MLRSPNFSNISTKSSRQSRKSSMYELPEAESSHISVVKDGQGQIVIIRSAEPSTAENSLLSKSAKNKQQAAKIEKAEGTAVEAQETNITMGEKDIAEELGIGESIRPAELIRHKLRRIEAETEFIRPGCCYHFKKSCTDDYLLPIEKLKLDLIKEGILVETAETEPDHDVYNDKLYHSTATQTP